MQNGALWRRQQWPTNRRRDDAAAMLDAVLPVILDAMGGLARYNCELLPDGREDPLTAAWVEGLRDAHDLVGSFRGGE